MGFNMIEGERKSYGTLLTGEQVGYFSWGKKY